MAFNVWKTVARLPARAPEVAIPVPA